MVSTWSWLARVQSGAQWSRGCSNLVVLELVLHGRLVLIVVELLKVEHHKLGVELLLPLIDTCRPAGADDLNLLGNKHLKNELADLKGTP